MCMGLVSIFAVALLAPFPLGHVTARQLAFRVFDTFLAQSPPPEEKPQNPATDQAQPDPADQKQTEDQKQPEDKPALTPPAKEEEKPKAQKPPSSQPANGKRKRRSGNHKPNAASPDGQSRKIVIRHGGTSEPIAQIVPGITQEEATHQRENAEQLLTSAESNLQQLAARTLKPNQLEIVVQIHQYMDGAHLALKEGDTQRAHTLALKAHLLADDLVRRPAN